MSANSEEKFESGWTLRTMKVFYDRIFSEHQKFNDERDKRYTEKFDSIIATAAATVIESQKALIKADESLTGYKAEANNIRGALNDWQGTVTRDMVTKTEMISTEGKVYAVIDGLRKQLEGSEATLRALIEGQGKLVNALQLSSAAGEGGNSAKGRFTMTTIAIIGLVLTCLTLLATLIFFVLSQKSVIH